MQNKDLNKGGTWQAVKRIKKWDRTNKALDNISSWLTDALGWMLLIWVLIGIYEL